MSKTKLFMPIGDARNNGFGEAYGCIVGGCGDGWLCGDSSGNGHGSGLDDDEGCNRGTSNTDNNEAGWGNGYYGWTGGNGHGYDTVTKKSKFY
jgi:hypothetical protein